jgi:hypothetical protein
MPGRGQLQEEALMPAVSEEAKERARARARERYREQKALEHPISTEGAYRAKGLGDGKNAVCPGCGKRFGPEDFTIDPYGNAIDPTLCLACRSS